MATYTVTIEMNIENPEFDSVEEANKWANAFIDELGDVMVPNFETVSWPTCAWRIYDENEHQVFP